MEKTQYEKHGDYLKNYMRNWMREHPHYMQKYAQKLKLKVLTHYSGDSPKCACCGETEIRFLTIDHIDGDGDNERRKISHHRSFSGGAFYNWLVQHNFPEGYQVMCSNCNMAKGKSKVQFCPVHHPEQY